MATFGDLIAGVQASLYSYGMQRDKMTTLIAGIDDSETTFPVADPALLDIGLIEVDQELMEVRSIDMAQGGLAILHPWGRGRMGTQKVAHPINSQIVISPRFPRAHIAATVKRTVASVYPDLFRIRTDESITTTTAAASYLLPETTDSIAAVAVLDSLGEWIPVTRYRVTDYVAGKSITFGDVFDGGTKVRLTYRSGFDEFATEADTLASVGLLDRWSDLIIYGAVGTMVLGLEPVRLQADTVETQDRAGATQPTQATQVARQSLGMFKQRIQEEKNLLERQYPPTLVRVGPTYLRGM